MLNILHLINYPGKGGSEKYILSLMEKLHDKSCKIYFGYSEPGPMLKRVKALGVQIYNIPMRSPCDVKAAKTLKALCRELSIDVVHTHFLRENCISILSKFLGNRVVIINSNHLLLNTNIFKSLGNGLITLGDDRLIAVSNAVRKHLMAEGVITQKITVIHNGVDIDYWKGRRNYNIRREFGIDRNDFVIVSTARFSEEKGHIFLLESIKQLKKICNSSTEGLFDRFKFILAGDGEMFEESKELAEMLGISGSIFFAGYRSDIKKILHGSDLYVSHSKSEALGISILEALACSLPVVATNSGGPSEIITGKSNCGILIEYGDTDAFAKAIMRFASDSKFYKTCKDNAYKTVEVDFNLDKTVEETYNLYTRSLTAGNA